MFNIRKQKRGVKFGKMAKEVVVAYWRLGMKRVGRVNPRVIEGRSFGEIIWVGRFRRPEWRHLFHTMPVEELFDEKEDAGEADADR